MSSLSLIALIRNERMLSYSLALCAASMVGLMWTVLNSVKEDSVIEPTPQKTQYITQDTEDSLPLETLEKLVQHPNQCIKELSQKILADRALDDKSMMNILMNGIASKHDERRLMCLQTLAFVLTNTCSYLDGPNGTLQKIYNQRTFNALVRCLEHSIKDSEIPILDYGLWDEFNLRNETERLALTFIYELTQARDADLLIKSKFVEKWLVKQPWGEGDDERQRNFKDYTNKRNKISDLIRCLQSSQRGMEVLRAAKLVPPSRKHDNDNKYHVQIKMSDIDDRCFSDGENVPAGSRSREQSEEEIRLRRQHREAMVFNDGTRPIGREDIIERLREDV
ncbi:hypothetical protein TD95_005298 [Thielaviopsis punctulata]|uniref:Cytoskeleton-associated protein n=1 Tax=Thielaviopsis punctulata TaxID=72032 RepID=A0A0F4ZFX0_9PEZI|nr:hypothetical protein TD95_005298 [Thielaviopsis punctulata]